MIKHAFTSAKADGGDATLIRPSNWNADHVVTTPVGISITTPNAALDVLKDSRLTASDTPRDFVNKTVINVSAITAWTTVQTISPSVADFWIMAIIDIILTGYTSTVGNGLIIGRRTIEHNGAAPTTNIVGPDVTSGTAIPQIQTIISGNNTLVQVKSSDGVNAFSGLLEVKATLPAGVGGNGPTVTWTIT